MKRRMRYVLVLAALCACAPAVEPHEPSTERPAKASAASFTEGMKPSVPPGDDFYAYTNGGWIEKTEIPKDKSSWGITEESAEKTDQRNAELIKQAGTSGSPEAKKVATFYAAYMDEATIEAKGLAPLDETFAAIAAIKDKKDLAKVLGGTIRADVDILNNTKVHTANVLGLWVAEDLDDPKQYAAFLIQGGLGMPDRDYYLDAAPKMAELPHEVPGPHRSRPRAREGERRQDQSGAHLRFGEANGPIARGRARTRAMSRRATTAGLAKTSIRRRRASIGMPSSPPRSSTNRRPSSCGARRR